MFEKVKETVAERILVKSWLDEETRTQALLKLRTLQGRFHVWPGFNNDTLLAHDMAEVKITLFLNDPFYFTFEWHLITFSFSSFFSFPSQVVIDPDNFFFTVLRRFKQIRTVDDKVLRRNVTEK